LDIEVYEEGGRLKKGEKLLLQDQYTELIAEMNLLRMILDRTGKW